MVIREQTTDQSQLARNCRRIETFLSSNLVARLVRSWATRDYKTDNFVEQQSSTIKSLDF